MTLKLEQQVVSLELAKKLKELGVKQESLFYWREDGGKLWRPADTDVDYEKAMGCISAFTVAELGEMLPSDTMSMEWSSRPLEKGKWHAGVVYFGEKRHRKQIFEADTEADARAKMLVYLLENKLITL